MPTRLRATDFRSLGMSAFPGVASEWRLLGHAFDGQIYFVYDTSCSPGAEIGAHVHSRRQGLSYADALVDLKRIAAQTKAQGNLAAAAQIVDPALVVSLIQKMDATIGAKVERFCAKPPPAQTMPMVVLEQKGVGLFYVPIPALPGLS